MIANDHELNASLERIRHLQSQVAHLRQNPANYHLSAAGFLAEIDECSWRCASTSHYTLAS